MECDKAKDLIDLRLHESAGDDTIERRDWSELDGHLAACRTCATDWIELQRTRALLSDVASDKPNTQEVESMWDSILAAAAGSLLGNRRGLWRFAAALTGMAAVLGTAFGLGHFNDENAQNRSRRVAALSNIRGIGTSSRIYGTNDSWGVPVYPHAGMIGPLADATTTRRYWEALRSPLWDNSTVEQFVSPSSTVEKELGPSSGRNLQKKRARGLSRATVGAYEWGGNSGLAADATGGLAESDSMVYTASVKKADISGEPLADSLDGAVADAFYDDAHADGALDASMEDELTAGVALDSLDEIDDLKSEMGPRQPAASATSNAILPQPSQLTPAKVIKTGTLAVEVESYAQAVERVTGLVADHRASIANVSTREQNAGALSGSLVIRVSPERFDALFAALKTVGRVESENAKVADVTADYVDVEARIASLEITQQRLSELITNKSFVDKMSALLEVEREMTRVRSQLEQLQGQLRVMADRIAHSTITMTLHEPARTVPAASLSVEVPVLDEAATALAGELGRIGGRLSSGNTTKQNDGTLRGTYQLRVSFARFTELLGAITVLGRVERRQISNHDLSHASAPWAEKAQCNLSVVLFERARQLPAGSILIEVDALAPSLVQLDAVLAVHGGSIVSNQSIRQSDGSSTAELSLRVPGGRFAALTEALESLGRITGKTVTGEAARIVGGAADVPCELSLRLSERPREIPSGRIILEVAEFGPARRQLSALVGESNVRVLASASEQRTDGSWVGQFRLGIASGEMEMVVARLEALGRVVRRQISGIGLGDLSRTNPDAIGFVDLTLAEKAAISPAPEKTGGSLRAHIRDGLAGLYRSIGFIAYGLIVMAPWLVVAVLLAWLLTRVWRSKQVASARK